MSGYRVEEPEEISIYYNTENNSEIIEYWLLHSREQKKRFKKVLFQMLDIWNDVENSINIMRNIGNIDIDESNFFMSKVHKMFIITHYNKINFYDNEKIKLRKQNNFKLKKINKLRRLIVKL